jgi:hypothetical protein
LGGEPATESIEQRAARVERAVTYEKRRETYLASDAGVHGANQSFDEPCEAILETVPRLQAAAPSLQISPKHQGRVLVMLSSKPALSVNWRLKYSNTLNESVLEASAWEGHPPFPGVQHWEQPQPLGKISMSPDLGSDDTHAWSIRTQQGKQQMGGKDAAEHIVGWWLEKYAMPRGVR